MEENTDIQIQVKQIPAFTVLKNGSILKNVFLLRKQSAAQKSPQNQESDEEILLVGRHPHCHIILEHPSISRYHLRIHSNPPSQMLSVVDLSSVHGTWVSGRKIEPGVHVILKEGDTVQLGGSSRVYELHWVPRSQAYDVDEQFVPAVYTIKEKGEDEEDESDQIVDQKHKEDSFKNDLESSDVSSSNKIHDSPLKTLDPLTSLVHDYFSSDTEVEHSGPLTWNESDDIVASVSTQAPLVVSETTSAIRVSDNLNGSDDQLMTNCSKSSCDDTEVKHSSPLKIGNENGELFTTVCIQAPLVASEDISETDVSASEAISEIDVSDCLNKSENELNWLRGNLSNEFDQISHGIIDLINAVDTHEKDAVNQNIASSNETEFDNENQQKINNGSDDIEQMNQIKMMDESASMVLYNGEDTSVNIESVDHEIMKKESVFMLLPDVADIDEDKTVAPDISKAKEIPTNPPSAQKLSASKSSCDDTEVKHLSPWKTGNENGELFTTVCIQRPLFASEVLSETDVSDCLHKSEEESNWLGGNLNIEFDQISHGTIDLINAVETHEKYAVNQNIASSNGTDIDNETQQKINNGSDDIEQMNQIKMMDELASMARYEGEDTSVNIIVTHAVADIDEDKTFTPEISKVKEIHTNPPSAQKLSASMKLFDSLDGKEMEFYTPDIQNKNPNACFGKSLSKKVVNPTVFGEKDILSFSQILLASDEGMCTEQEVDSFVNLEQVLTVSSEKENYPQTVQKNLAKKRWTMVVDTSSLLDPKSLKHIKLLEGIKGTKLFVPKNVVRELMDIKSQDSFFKRDSKKASLALKWIDEWMMNTRWWIHMDDDESFHSSAAVPEVLAIALHLREEVTDQNIIILGDSLTLKINAMAEGIMCEAAEEFHESLVNPFSERFMWVGSLARGLTWSCVDDDDDFVRHKYHGFGSDGSHRFKGLKLLARAKTSQLVN